MPEVFDALPGPYAVHEDSRGYFQVIKRTGRSTWETFAPDAGNRPSAELIASLLNKQERESI